MTTTPPIDLLAGSVPLDETPVPDSLRAYYPYYLHTGYGIYLGRRDPHGTWQKGRYCDAGFELVEEHPTFSSAIVAEFRKIAAALKGDES